MISRFSLYNHPRRVLSNAYPVSFYTPESSDAELIASMHSADDDPSLFTNGRACWVWQTFLRLRQAGFPVSLTSDPSITGIVVVHSDDRGKLSAQSTDRVTKVVACADRGPAFDADIQVFQNGYYAVGRRRLFVPHWPQPGLVPRAQTTSLAKLHHRAPVLAYTGILQNLHPYFLSDEWMVALERMGIEYRLALPCQDSYYKAWDCRDVDMVIAVRPDLSSRYLIKPASKLVNSWLARTPALLGREYAYREVGRPGLDYIEIDQPEVALLMLRRLLTDSRLYEQLVTNGAKMGEQFSVERISNRWAAVLFAAAQDLHQQALRRRLGRRLSDEQIQWIRRCSHRAVRARRALLGSRGQRRTPF
jgi:hypothetical protein